MIILLHSAVVIWLVMFCNKLARLYGVTFINTLIGLNVQRMRNIFILICVYLNIIVIGDICICNSFFFLLACIPADGAIFKLTTHLILILSTDKNDVYL